MPKLRKMLQRADDVGFASLPGLMALMLCEVSQEEMCREKSNLPLFRTIPQDGPWERQPNACWVMLVHAGQGTAWLCFCLLFSSRLKWNQESLVLIKQPWRKITCQHCSQQGDFQQMVVVGLAFSVKWP